MRLTNVITPELILGTRGDEKAIAIYKRMLSEIQKVGLGPTGGMLCGPEVTNLDQITRLHFAIAWKFKHESPKVYQVGKQFAQALSEIDRNIPIDKLPQRFFGYFSFPNGTFTEPDGGDVRGGFIFIGPWYETVCKPLEGEDRVVWISYDCFSKRNDGRDYFGSFNCASLVVQMNGNDLKKIIESAPETPGSKQEPTSEVFRTLVNLVMYVNSSDPTLLPTRPIQQTSISQRKKFFNLHGAANLCTVPVTFVSWNFNRPMIRHVDSTMVKGHGRWQRHGPGMREIKLIWISEHERHFKVTEEPTKI